MTAPGPAGGNLKEINGHSHKTAVLRDHSGGKGRRDRQQQNILCECPLTTDPMVAERCRLEKERPRLDRATPATSPRNHTHVLVHWESYLQGFQTPATEPARADSDNRDRGPEQPLRSLRAGPCRWPGAVTQMKSYLNSLN